MANIFIPAPGRLRWEEAEASLGYVLRLFLKGGKKGHQEPKIEGSYLAKQSNGHAKDFFIC